MGRVHITTVTTSTEAQGRKTKQSISTQPKQASMPNASVTLSGGVNMQSYVTVLMQNRDVTKSNYYEHIQLIQETLHN